MQHVYMGALAFLAGFGVSAGTFAFILIIGVVPRIMQRFEIGNVMLIENVIVSGVILGNISSIYNGSLPISLGHFSIIIYALATGIFVGCIAVALAEILHTFPILFARLELNRGLKAVVSSMAFGKLAGSLFYFLYGYMR